MIFDKFDKNARCWGWFLSNPSPSIALSCQSVSHSVSDMFLRLDWCDPGDPCARSRNLSLPYFTEFCQTKPVGELFFNFEAEVFVLRFCWICQSCYRAFSNLLHGFAEIDTTQSLWEELEAQLLPSGQQLGYACKFWGRGDFFCPEICKTWKAREALNRVE